MVQAGAEGYNTDRVRGYEASLLPVFFRDCSLGMRGRKRVWLNGFAFDAQLANARACLPYRSRLGRTTRFRYPISFRVTPPYHMRKRSPRRSAATLPSSPVPPVPYSIAPYRIACASLCGGMVWYGMLCHVML